LVNAIVSIECNACADAAPDTRHRIVTNEFS
jgi:hypothetical protein